MNTREEQIELVKKLLKTGVSDDVRKVLEKQFPEVVESEDERIGNLIYCIIRDREDVRDTLEANGVSVDSALSYLEKKKEQNKSHLSLTEEELHKIRSEEYTNGFNDAAFGGKYKGWSEEDKSILNNIFAYKVLNIDDLEWLKSLPERFNLQPKPAEWSEEGYGRLFDIEHYLDGTLQLSPDRKIACIAWLKSLRPQPHWKPSDEQMKALDKVINGEVLLTTQHKSLDSLYNDLNKLI